jgi:VanZ family protein
MLAGLGWAMVAAIVWLSLVPNAPELDIAQGDKLGHLAGYGAITFWFCALYSSSRVRLAYAAGFAAMGIALEVVQGMLGYRTYDPIDMLANTLGVLLGWTAALVLPRLLPAR